MSSKRLRKFLCKQTKGKCFYCGKKISWKRKKGAEKASIDHYIPKFHGGKNGKSNLRASCTECNYKKGHLMPEEFQTRGAA